MKKILVISLIILIIGGILLLGITLIPTDTKTETKHVTVTHMDIVGHRSTTEYLITVRTDNNGWVLTLQRDTYPMYNIGDEFDLTVNYGYNIFGKCCLKTYELPYGEAFGYN